MMLLLKVIGTFTNELCWKTQTRAVHGQKTKIDVEKNDDEIIILVTLLERSVNDGRTRDRKIHASRSI